MMQYKIINAYHLRSLEAIVEINILKGWHPQGGICHKEIHLSEEPIYGVGEDGESLIVEVAEAKTRSLWTQAMVRP